MKQAPGARRPIRARSQAWAQRLASLLVRSGWTPNQISVASVVFAAAGASLLAWWPTTLGLILVVLCIQLRLLCNLFDGMVAIEGGKQTPLGAIYNEFPDRLADSLLFIALGTAIARPELGWAAALVAALTAYVRVFAGSLGLEQDFRGPMAKQQRMAVLSLACLLAAWEPFWSDQALVLPWATYLLIGGGLWTCVRRTLRMASLLQNS